MKIDESSIKVIQSARFIKELKKLGKRYDSVRKDIQPLIEQLKDGETPGDRITGNKYPDYKIRVKNSDIKKGQSSGYRIIYYIRTTSAILLTNIYSKSDQSDISNKEVQDVIEQYELEIELQEKEVTIAEAEDSGTGDRSTF